jgi:hypothetical protein
MEVLRFQITLMFIYPYARYEGVWVVEVLLHSFLILALDPPPYVWADPNGRAV